MIITILFRLEKKKGFVFALIFFFFFFSFSVLKENHLRLQVLIYSDEDKRKIVMEMKEINENVHY